MEGPRANYDVLIGTLTGSMQGNNFNVGTTAAYGIAGDYCSEIVWGKCIHPRIPFSCGTNGEEKRKVYLTQLKMLEKGEVKKVMQPDGKYLLVTTKKSSKVKKEALNYEKLKQTL